MRQAHAILEIPTRGRGLQSITKDVTEWLGTQQAEAGLLTLFIQHTSASLLIQENADRRVQTDLERWLSRLVKDGDTLFEHTGEGPDDMPAHVRAALTGTQVSIPILEGGRLALGTWQGIFLYEHRTAAHRRRVVLHYLGT